MDQNTLSILNEKFHGRKEQISKLCRFFPQDKNVTLCPYIILEGLPGSGRRAILEELLQMRKIFYISVNSVETFDLYDLYSQLVYCEEPKEKYDEVYEGIDCLAAVYNYYKKSNLKSKLRCIMIKNSQLLPQSIILQLCKFRKLLCEEGWNFSIVFITDHSTHIYQIEEILSVQIFFPLYEKDELVEILSKDRDDVFRNFLYFFLPVAMLIFPELPDLERLADKYYPIYRKPIDEGVVQADEVALLGKMAAYSINLNNYSVMYSWPENISETLNLPLCTKYLLLASFLASFVPKNKDRIFSRESSKKKKRNVHMTVKQDQEAHILRMLEGPKYFPLSRLIYIYEAIVSEKTSVNVNLMLQVSSLVHLGWLTSRGDVGEIQYKCVVDSVYIHAVAKNAEFDIDKFLVY